MLNLKKVKKVKKKSKRLSNQIIKKITWWVEEIFLNSILVLLTQDPRGAIRAKSKHSIMSCPHY